MSTIELPSGVSPRSGLTREEDSIINSTAEILRTFNRLPNKVPSDVQTIAKAIHDIQCIVATNALARLFPYYWVTPDTRIAGDSENTNRPTDEDTALL